MLEQPMIEKLLSMRLQGMADALKAQEQDPGARELSFVERLSLLVDQQWNWRENQALTRRLKSAKLRHNACIEDIDYRAARGLEKSVIRGLAKDSQWVQNHENLFRSRTDRSCDIMLYLTNLVKTEQAALSPSGLAGLSFDF